MKVVGAFHMYPPAHGAGAEWMAHEIMLYLQRQGADVQIVLRDDAGVDSFEGIPIKNKAIGELGYFTRWADVAFTHLDVTRIAQSATRATKTPLVHLIHNHMQVRTYNLQPRNAALLVYNSEYVSNYTPRSTSVPGLVVNPYVPVDRYRTDRTDAEYVTMVNLFQPKGSDVFWHLAERHPHRRFLAVIGAYGKQDIRRRPNVTFQENTNDMPGDVYSQTRVLLMPSKAESWGRVAIEAACSGIPSIVSKAPGLVESMGGAALSADASNIDVWDSMLQRLDDPETYERYSLLAEQRAYVLEERAQEQMAALWEKLGEF